MSKIVIVGANHAGIAAANTILDNYPENEVVILDRNSNMSYLGCGTALWVGRQIEGYEGLFYTKKEDFEAKGAIILMETVVDRIDFDKKVVFGTKKDGSAVEQSYDKLILATGSIPLNPPIPGRDLKHIQNVKVFQEGALLDETLNDAALENVAVIGAGYIGVEIAEAAKRRGKTVRLFDALDSCLGEYYDRSFTDRMAENMKNHGIELHFSEKVQEFKGTDQVSSIVTDKGEYAADVVVMSVGFRPNNQLGKETLDLTKNGAYRVNLKQETSLKDVYAVGDCASIYSNATQSETYIALATNAVRSGIVAGHNVCGTPLESIGVQGSSGISIFGYNMVSTGLTVRAAERLGMDVSYTEYEDMQKPEFIKEGNEKVNIRIVYETTSRRVIGAQIASFDASIAMGIHMFSLAVEEKVTIDKLKLLDIFFLPHFNKPYNYITMAALSAK